MKLLTVHDELSTKLLCQDFATGQNPEEVLQRYRDSVKDYVSVDNSVAVLSDLQADKSYIYAGGFGEFFGFPSNNMVIESAFEELIFNKIHPDDLTERHVLEIRYFKFQKSIPPEERTRYSTVCKIRAVNHAGNYVYITHRTLYIKSLNDGNVWLALCLYSPCTDQYAQSGIDGKIMDGTTGEALPVERYKNYDELLLSKRETAVLSLIAQGIPSKQIALKLNISLNTVHRHRQNILSKLQVANSAEAVKTTVMMGIIKTMPQ